MRVLSLEDLIKYLEDFIDSFKFNPKRRDQRPTLEGFLEHLKNIKRY